MNVQTTPRHQRKATGEFVFVKEGHDADWEGPLTVTKRGTSLLSDETGKEMPHPNPGLGPIVLGQEKAGRPKAARCNGKNDRRKNKRDSESAGRS